jgi:hypothetical protein
VGEGPIDAVLRLAEVAAGDEGDLPQAMSAVTA